MSKYDITFRLVASEPDAEWLEDTANCLMDYFLNNGHDIVSGLDLAEFVLELELIGFEADSDAEALRMASEMLNTAAVANGVDLEPFDPPRKGPTKKGLFKKSSLVAA